jgi:hypothetical protein
MLITPILVHRGQWARTQKNWCGALTQVPCSILAEIPFFLLDTQRARGVQIWWPLLLITWATHLRASSTHPYLHLPFGSLLLHHERVKFSPKWSSQTPQIPNWSDMHISLTWGCSRVVLDRGILWLWRSPYLVGAATARCLPAALIRCSGPTVFSYSSTPSPAAMAMSYWWSVYVTTSRCDLNGAGMNIPYCLLSTTEGARRCAVVDVLMSMSPFSRARPACRCHAQVV